MRLYNEHYPFVPYTNIGPSVALQGDQVRANASLCLTLPGRKLNLSALLTLRKFRKRGDKEGALAGFRALESAKLGQIQSSNPKRGTSTVSYINVPHKAHISFAGS